MQLAEFSHNVQKSIWLAELHVDWEVIVLFILDFHTLFELVSSFFDLADFSDNQFIAEFIGFLFNKCQQNWMLVFSIDIMNNGFSKTSTMAF